MTFIAGLGGMQAVQKHACALTHYLAQAMAQLTHRSSHRLCLLYGDHETTKASAQGPVVAFNLQWADGSPVGFAEVGRRADEDGIQLRTGCFCNVGACQEALGLSSEDVKRNYALGRSCADTSSSSGKSSGSSGSSDTSSSGGSNGGGDVFDIINGRPSGAVRVSMGFGSSREDCDAMLSFLRRHFLDRSPRFLDSLLPPPRSGSAGMANAGADSDSEINSMCLYQLLRNGGDSGGKINRTNSTNSIKISNISNISNNNSNENNNNIIVVVVVVVVTVMATVETGV